ncbi:hypothetical protein K435DRAFT_805422 [Dendrothele bispora CBS 962.96]|uniref:Uncharacterized protein n=1 Tax=Dendrothele bispora (strain CBS 962.96) TaxID=1314807 RepID=A0A4S8LBR5_DENBC|nr:hypothetical protein K435DRAFT_805422 [Dendrothele bispora CBS 962.96]
MNHLDKSKTKSLVKIPTPPASLDINTYAPFDSAAEFLLVDWAYRFPRTGVSSLNNLVHGVILNPDFQSSTASLSTFSAQTSFSKLDNTSESTNPEKTSLSDDSDQSLPFLDVAPDAWYSGSVKIPAPKAGCSFESEAEAPHLEIDEVWYRKPMDAIRNSFQEKIFYEYHLKSFKWFWKRTSDGHIERVYSEAYTSDRASEMEQDLHNNLPPAAAADPSIENVIVWIMLWSDSTHLAQFGTASLWPIYMYIGNLSKYVRVKPSAYAAHHLAYIPSLPDLIKDKYFEIYGSKPSDAVIRFLKRELFHAIYFLLLDPEFREAYLNGMLVTCADGILRRLFPRLFSYSADYPEKVLIACIKYLGEWLCTRCLIPMDDVHLLGLKRDMINRGKLRREFTENHKRKIEDARRFIFEDGYGVESEAVKRILAFGSLTPSRSAFSTLLHEQGVDTFHMITPEKLHEWDVGRIKDFVTQVVRIMHCLKGDVITAFNRRFRWVPTFGRGIIRRFHNNVSEMKKLAGRDHTAILECLMPVMEGLFPESQDEIISDIIFDLLVWHCYAKLRMHTDTTLRAFEIATRKLGQAFRRFAREICSAYDTVELPQERATRLKNEARKEKRINSESSKEKKRTFNNSTAKMHALGDYPWAIRYYGTTDGWDTRAGEQEHKRVKSYYARTNKNKHAAQIARHERRVRCLRRIQQRNDTVSRTKLSVGAWEEERVPNTDPYLRYHMASGKKFFLDLAEFIDDHRRDPATTDFLRNLKHYILNQLFNKDEFTEEEYAALTFENNRLYKHKVVRVNYTSYDLRRGQDSINPRTHPDIMVLSSPGSDHPFAYARVVGVFHCNARFSSPRNSQLRSIPLKHVDMLWVRWFEYDTEYMAGWSARRLHRVKFVHATDPTAFDFIHPSDIVRAVHLIPSFTHLGTDSGLPPTSVGRQFESTSYAGPRELEDDDWMYYYVNMFVESDIFMLFIGGGIGHQELHENLRTFAVDAGLEDLDLPDYDSDGNEIGLGDDLEPEVDVDEDLEDFLPMGEQSDIGSQESSEEEELEQSDEEWLDCFGPEDGDDGLNIGLE